MGLVNGLTITGCSSSDQLYSMLMDYNKVCILVIVSTHSFITSLEIRTFSFSLLENEFELVIVILNYSLVILILCLPCLLYFTVSCFRIRSTGILSGNISFSTVIIIIINFLSTFHVLSFVFFCET